MTHCLKALFFCVFAGTSIAAVILRRRHQRSEYTCEHEWCGEKNNAFYDISHALSRRENLKYKHVAYASHVINFGVVGAGVPLEIFFMRYYDNNKAISPDVPRILLMYLLSVGMVYAVTLLFKTTIPRQRPAAYFNMTNVTELGTKNAADEWESFFSGDSSLAVHAAVFFILFSTGIRNSWRWVGSVLFSCLALAGLSLRVIALMHWSSDVLMGAAVGLMVAASARACFPFPPPLYNDNSKKGYVSFDVRFNSVL